MILYYYYSFLSHTLMVRWLKCCTGCVCICTAAGCKLSVRPNWTAALEQHHQQQPRLFCLLYCTEKRLQNRRVHSRFAIWYLLLCWFLFWFSNGSSSDSNAERDCCLHFCRRHRRRRRQMWILCVSFSFAAAAAAVSAAAFRFSALEKDGLRRRRRQRRELKSRGESQLNFGR